MYFYGIIKEMEVLKVDNYKNETMKFEVPKENMIEPKEILLYVYDALKEKQYEPTNQIIGYILSGDPTYITSHKDARTIIKRIERDEILEEILKEYLKHNS